MRGLLASFVLCIFAFMQVDSYVVTVDSFITSTKDSPIIVEEVNMIDYDSEFEYFDVYDYSVTLNFTNEEDNDIPLEYLYIYNNDDVADKGNTSLCRADLSTVEGTVAAVVAMALGIMSDPVCSLQESKLFQKSVFELQGGDFSNLPNSRDENGTLSVNVKVFYTKYMSLELSITDDDYWYDESSEEDPDGNTLDDDTSDNENQDENKK